MTTISGTILTGPSLTLATLADQIQASYLNDTAEATYTQTQVEQWLKDAIRDYSLHFPRQLSHTISTTADQRTYSLPALFTDMLSVEYPAGQDNPEYLTRRAYTHESFWGNNHYDIVPREDDSDQTELWIGPEPAASESITIEYHAYHNYDIDSADPVTVPQVHHHILIIYVMWQSIKLLQTNEQQNPTSSSSLMMSLLAQNAQQEYNNYIKAMKDAVKERPSKPGVLKWNNSVETEQIY